MSNDSQDWGSPSRPRGELNIQEPNTAYVKAKTKQVSGLQTPAEANPKHRKMETENRRNEVEPFIRQSNLVLQKPLRKIVDPQDRIQSLQEHASTLAGVEYAESIDVSPFKVPAKKVILKKKIGGEQKQGGKDQHTKLIKKQNQQEVIQDIMRRINEANDQNEVGELPTKRIIKAPKRYKPKAHLRRLTEAIETTARDLAESHFIETGLTQQISRKNINQNLNHAINVLRVSRVIGTPEQSPDLQEIQMMQQANTTEVNKTDNKVPKLITVPNLKNRQRRFTDAQVQRINSKYQTIGVNDSSIQSGTLIPAKADLRGPKGSNTLGADSTLEEKDDIIGKDEPTKDQTKYVRTLVPPKLGKGTFKSLQNSQNAGIQKMGMFKSPSVQFLNDSEDGTIKSKQSQVDEIQQEQQNLVEKIKTNQLVFVPSAHSLSPQNQLDSNQQSKLQLDQLFNSASKKTITLPSIHQRSQAPTSLQIREDKGIMSVSPSRFLNNKSSRLHINSSEEHDPEDTGFYSNCSHARRMKRQHNRKLQQQLMTLSPQNQLTLNQSPRFDDVSSMSKSGLQLNRNYIKVKSKIADYVHGNQKIDDLIDSIKESSPRLNSLGPYAPLPPGRLLSIQPQSTNNSQRVPLPLISPQNNSQIQKQITKDLGIGTQQPLRKGQTSMSLSLNRQLSCAQTILGDSKLSAPGRSPSVVKKTRFSLLDSTARGSEVPYQDQEAVLAGTDLTTSEFIQVVEEQVGDPRHFLKLKGINLNNRKELFALINNGIAIREHFRRQMSSMQAKKEIHKKAIFGLATHLQKSMLAKKKEEEEQDSSKRELNQMVNNLPEMFKFSSVNKKVEQRLTEKPLVIPGCGLPDHFKEIFKKREQSHAFQDIEKIYQSSKNHQIYLNSMANKSSHRHKKDEEQLFKELKHYLEQPVNPTFVGDGLTADRSKSFISPLIEESEDDLNVTTFDRRTMSPTQDQQKNKVVKLMTTPASDPQDGKVGEDEAKLTRALRSYDLTEELKRDSSNMQGLTKNVHVNSTLQTGNHQKLIHGAGQKSSSRLLNQQRSLSQIPSANEEIISVIKDIVMLDEELGQKDRRDLQLVNKIYSKQHLAYRELGSTKGIRY